MVEKRPLRRQPEDHHFWSLKMLAVMAVAFLLIVGWPRRRYLFSSKSLRFLENRLAKACPCFEWVILILECSMRQRLALEEIAPEDKNRTEVLRARVALYIAAKKWDMAATVASHLVKVEPENEAWWISLAYSVRRSEGIEKAEAILLRAQAIHPKVAMIAFNLACYASVTGRIEDAKERLRRAIDLDKDVRNWRSTMKI